MTVEYSQQVKDAVLKLKEVLGPLENEERVAALHWLLPFCYHCGCELGPHRYRPDELEDCYCWNDE